MMFRSMIYLVIIKNNSHSAVQKKRKSVKIDLMEDIKQGFELTYPPAKRRIF